MDYKKIYFEEHIKNHLTYKQIREKYNIPRGTWDYYIRQKEKLAFDKRKHVPNDNFFDTIDSEIKAYILGYLYADGYICSDGRIGIRLSIKDEEIIRLMKQYLFIDSNIEYSNNQNIHRTKQISIRCKSPKLYSMLVYYGFQIDKTHEDSNILNKIPDEMKIHFIRGYCDGDGSIRFDRNNKKHGLRTCVSFCNGTRKILDDINVYFGSDCNGTIHYYPKKHFYLLSFDNAFGAYYVVSKLYKNANFYLNRKRELALKIINFRTNTELTGKHKRFPVV